MHQNNYSVTQPDVPPGWLANLKRQCDIADDETGWDAELCDKLASAVEVVQTDANRQLLTATVVWKLDAFPYGQSIDMPYGPLQSVTSIQYVDEDGATQTLSTDVYSVDTTRDAGMIHRKYNQSWPTSRCEPNAVTVTYVAGQDQSDLARDALHCVILLARHYFDRNDGAAEPEGYRHLVNRLKFGEGVL